MNNYPTTKKSNLYNANIQSSLFCFFITTVCQFLFRSIFLEYIGKEFLGLAGMFSGVIGSISVIELGISQAILQTFFAPIAKNDSEELSLAVTVLKKASFFAGVAIFIICFAISDNLSFFAKTMPDIPGTKKLFLLFSLNMVLPYFFASQRSLIICYGRLYVASYAQGLFCVLSTAVQILLLLLGKGYEMCLITGILFTVAEGVFYNIYVKLYLPRIIKGVKYTQKYFGKVKRNFSGLIFHKLGGICYANTDNLLTSKMLGLGYTALFSNYGMIIGTVNAVPPLILNSFTAEIGNNVCTKTSGQNEKIYRCLYLANLWMNTVCSCMLLVTVNPALSLWLGKNMLLPEKTVKTILLYYFFAGLRDVPLLFRNSYGLFYEERKKPIIQAIINLCLMPPLIKLMGFTGVFLSELITILLCCVFYEPYVLYKHGFGQKFGVFLRDTVIKMLFSLFCIFCVDAACACINSFDISALYKIIINCVLSVTTITFAFLIAFGKSDEAKTIISFIKSAKHTKIR